MNYVESLNLLGVEAKEIPCIKGKGAPTTATEGAVGCFYMDTDTGEVYKCISATRNVYLWEGRAVAESRLTNTTANALKGTARGETILLNDVSPLEHAVAIKVSGVDKPANVKVTATAKSKNLFNYKDFADWATSIGVASVSVDSNYLEKDCFSFSLWQDSVSYIYDRIKFKRNTQYTFSINSASPNKVKSLFLVWYTDGSYDKVNRMYDNPYFYQIRYTSRVGKTVAGITIERNNNLNTCYIEKNMQIEEGTSATEYEPFEQYVECTLGNNGACEVGSVYPSMSFSTDTDGAIIEVEYNRDIHAAVGDIATALDGILAIQNSYIGGDV